VYALVTNIFMPVEVGKRLACVSGRRFSDFGAYPKTASINDVITVAGKLEQHPPIRMCQWIAASGDPVELYIDGKKVKETTTASDGSFSFQVKASDLGYGRHIVQCKAPETAWGCEAKSPEVAVDVVTEEEKKRIEQQEQTMELLKWLGIGGAVAVAAAIGFMLYEREKRMEMTRLILMMRR